MTTEEEIYSNLLRGYAKSFKLLSGRAIHARFIKGSLPLSIFLQNHLLNMYVKSGDVLGGLKVFEEMPQKNVVSWSAVIAGFIQNGYVQGALSLFARMHSEGATKPNEFTLVSALQACSLAECVTQAHQIYALIVKSGFGSNIFLVNAFLTSLVRHGKLTEALEVFQSCQEKDIVSWNTMMGGYLQYSFKDIPGFWYHMNYKGVEPDNFSFTTILTGLAALSHLQLGTQVHGQLIKSGYGDEICVGNSLVDMYLKNQKLAEGFKAFDEMPQRDVCSWSQMAAGCLQCGEPRRALEVVTQMRKVGVKPNRFTLATALNACANMASLEVGKQLHGLRIKLGDDIDVCVDNALLDMYAKCGCMDNVCLAFQTMKDHTVISWTTLIMACAQNGQAKEALEMFDEMRKTGVEPNSVTFICVLYACCQGRLIDEGWKYFSSMTKDYGISAGEDHYVCMVNLLGRAGHIKEAMDLILKMPFEPGAPVWQTLLCACQIHGDVEIGKLAAKRAMEQDKKDPSTYVVLSNMFAGLSNWDGVWNLRELMELRDVKKKSGSSWIEIG
ncbi:hypothetical protein QN277_001840 [Acacia crassicarpa]|uniref:Pentatricopeptide repeat-containing protein n=2 Tax=Acacia crassicarpa TaxID=499986 RepID=A0AAE1N7X3_9FABA|nr:hypothetical protein QN277_001840 [Acacia crassicarpa]